MTQIRNQLEPDCLPDQHPQCEIRSDIMARRRAPRFLQRDFCHWSLSRIGCFGFRLVNQRRPCPPVPRPDDAEYDCRALLAPERNLMEILETHLPACRHQAVIDQLREALNATLLGKSDVVELVLACLLARGHLLFDDLPGLGKTTLAKAVAHAVGGNSRGFNAHPICCPATSRVSICSISVRENSSSPPARSSRMSCWRMRSIALPLARKALCSRPWRNGK